MFRFVFGLFLVLFGTVYCFDFPKTLVLPINYFDYAEWQPRVDASNPKDKIKGTYARTTDEKKFIRDHYKNFQSTDSGRMAAAACDFDICAIDNHNSDCPKHKASGGEKDIVADELTPDGLPTRRFVNSVRKEGVATKGLEFWYRNHTLNKGVVANITLKLTTATATKYPIYRYDASKDFHPLVDVVGTYYCPKKGDAGCRHKNFVFASHFKGFINYDAETPNSQTIKINSDDDSFLFVDKRLAFDWGGTRPPSEQTVNLDKLKLITLEHGEKYQVDFFHADRCPTQSAFTIQGTFTCDTYLGNQVDTDKDGVPDCMDGCPDDPWMTHETLECKCNEHSCLKCNMISANMCLAANSKFAQYGLKCDLCNGECVDKGTCPCSSFAEPNQCNAYTDTSSQNLCKWCKNSGTNKASCVPIEKCSCDSYSDKGQCQSADSPFYQCRWCNGHCVDNANIADRNKYCSCGDKDLTTQDACLDIYDITKDSTCVWCKYSENLEIPEEPHGYCGDTCKCETLNSLEIKSFDGFDKKCTDFSIVHKLRNGEIDPILLKCKACTQTEDGNDAVCVSPDVTCSVCSTLTTEKECKEGKYPFDDYITKNCLWCGSSCVAADECPDCKAYNDDADKCELALDADGARLGCNYCFKGACTSEKCPTCSEISTNYCKAMKDFMPAEKWKALCSKYDDDLLYLDNVKTMQEFCTSSIQNKCHFCGNIEINSGEFSGEQVPALCVSDTNDCPLCSEIPDYPHKDFTDAQRNCEALSFVYSELEPKQDGKPPGDNGMQRCGYCEYTNTCVDLGTKIAEHDAIESDEEKEKFVFDNFCDTNCHNYDSNKVGCENSSKECGWCELPNGSSTCNSVNEECAHCAEYTSDFLCLASGCTWCKQTNECISKNFKCSNPSAVAAGIGAGVVAAIVIGAIVALVIASFASKKMYDAIMDARAASMDTATSNPLFEDDTSGGINPAFAAE